MKLRHYLISYMWIGIELLVKLFLLIALLVVTIKSLPYVIKWLLHID